MRRIATLVFLALLAPTLGTLAAPGPGDCCPMGGDMSCCAKASAPDAGCGLSRCAPDSERGFAPPLLNAVLTSTTVVVTFTASRPLSTPLSVSPDSIPPDPLFPPPRA